MGKTLGLTGSTNGMDISSVPAIGFGPVRLIRYAGLAALPLLYRRVRRQGTLWEQLRGWNLNLAVCALLGDVFFEIALFFVSRVQAGVASNVEIYAGLIVTIIAMALNLGRLYYATVGISHSYSWLKGVIVGS